PKDSSNLTLSSITSSVSCGCDSGGTITTAACTTIVNPSAGTCGGGGHWVVIVSVTATGTFYALFHLPGIPASITVSRTSAMRVAQNRDEEEHHNCELSLSLSGRAALPNVCTQ